MNAGGARFLEGDPIVMTGDDVAEVAARVPTSSPSTWRRSTTASRRGADVRARVPAALVPEDGETLEL